MLTIAVSSRSLFHIEDGNEIFVKEGQEAFNAYMRSKETVPLRPGVAFPLVKKLLALNTIDADKPKERVDVILLSRNSPDAGMRVLNSLEHYGLPIERAIFSQGGDRFRYVQAAGAHLFLSANPADVETAIAHNVAAATMLPAEAATDPTDMTVRIAFDGDAVIFNNEADECYRQGGLEAFRRHEAEKATVPLEPGPFKPFLQALHELQQEFPPEKAPVRVGLVTARGLPSHVRVIHTLRHWGIRLDEAIFAGGRPKGPLLKAFGADMFFDDTKKNIESAASYSVPAGHVPYGAGQGIVGDDKKVA